MVETKMEPGPDLVGGVVCYMNDAFGLCAVHTDSEEQHVNGYFAKVATSYPPPTGVECRGEAEHPAIPGARACTTPMAKAASGGHA